MSTILNETLIGVMNFQTDDYFFINYLVVLGKNVTWFRPRNITELLSLKEKYPNAKIVVGNTEIGMLPSVLEFSRFSLD